MPDSAASGTIMDLAGVGKVFRSRDRKEVVALTPTDLRVRAGEFLSIVGPSGCGKTTLLNLMAGLIEPSAGAIRFPQAKAARPQIGFVFQRPVLLPWRRVIDNVMLPVEVLRLAPRAEYEARAHELLAMVGLKGFEASYPGELSGGMQQRVSIVRSLVYDCPVLLMDEPFAALDAMTREELNLELLRIWTLTGRSIVFVTPQHPRSRAAERPHRGDDAQAGPDARHRGSGFAAPALALADGRSALRRPGRRHPRHAARPGARVIGERTTSALYAGGTLVFVLVVWQVAVRLFDVPAYFIPAPTDVVLALVRARSLYAEHYLVTLWSTLAAFSIAFVLAVLMGALVSESRFLERTLYPLLVALQSMPRIALAPVIIVWFGFGPASKIVLGVLSAFFPIFLNTAHGMKMVDSDQVALMRTLHASRAQIFWTIKLPNALPFLLAGANIGIIFAILAVIVGEFLGANRGMGFLIVNQSNQMDTPGVFANVVLLSATGLVFHYGLGALRHRLLFWAGGNEVSGAKT